MALQLPGGKKGERLLKRILQPAKDRAIDEGLPEIPGAAKVIAKMEKDITGLDKRIKLLESRTGKLWSEKVQREISIAQKADNEATGGR